MLTLVARFARDPLLKAFLRLTLPQEAVAIGNKIENLLLHVAALEALFTTRPGDVEEQRRRNELIRYVVIVPFRPNAEFCPASSMASRNSCARCTGGQDCRNLMNMLKAVKTCSGFSKISKGPSPTTGFVRSLTIFPIVDKDNRPHNRSKSMNKDANK